MAIQEIRLCLLPFLLYVNLFYSLYSPCFTKRPHTHIFCDRSFVLYCCIFTSYTILFCISIFFVNFKLPPTLYDAKNVRRRRCSYKSIRFIFQSKKALCNFLIIIFRTKSKRLRVSAAFAVHLAFYQHFVLTHYFD